MKFSQSITFLLVGVLSFALPGWAEAQNTVSPAVVGSGAGSGSGGGFSVSGTAGQVVVSTGSGGGNSVASGFWNGLNQGPVSIAVSANPTIIEGLSQDVTITATDANGGTPTLSASGVPGFGSFTDNGGGNGTLSLSPQVGNAGSYSVIVTATAGGETAQATVSVTVVANQVPVLAAIGDQTLLEDIPLDIQISATDGNGTTPTLSVSGASFASLVDDGDGTGTLTLSPVLADVGTHTVTVTASDGTLTDSETFQVVVNERPAPEIVLGLNGYAADGGLVEIRNSRLTGYDHQAWTRIPLSSYNNANGETHVAMGDLDGDGLDEFVVGLGYGGGGRVYVYDDANAGYASLGWITIPWAWYNSYNGKTWPGVGDIDGDGKAEVVVGLGYGGRGYVAVFDDIDASTAGFPFVKWLHVGGYYGDNRPAVGDLDGDGKDEIVVGMGYYGRGYLAVFDDSGTNYAFRKWLQVPWYDYTTLNYNNYYWYTHYHAYSRYSRRWYGWYTRSGYRTYSNPLFNGETRPAVGDVDGDGRAEIVVGLGTGGKGYTAVFDDANANYTFQKWLRVPRSSYTSISILRGYRSYRSRTYYSSYYRRYYYYHGYYYYQSGYNYDRANYNGETRPAVGDIDGDGRAEIVLGLGSKGQGLMSVFDDASAGYAFDRWLTIPHSSYNAADGGSWPAIGEVAP